VDLKGYVRYALVGGSFCMTALDYIRSRAAGAAQGSPEAAVYANLADFVERKLWHQLTQELLSVINKSTIDKQVELYHEFIRDFANKLNPVSLARLLKQIVANECSDPKQALELLEPQLVPDSSFVYHDTEARVLILSEVSVLRLNGGDRDEAKSRLQTARSLVDGADEDQLSKETRSAFYAAAASFHKIVGTAAEFYKNAMLFLAYMEVDSLPVATKNQWAFDLSVAALVGEEIFNFGELLTHQVVKDMQHTEFLWVFQLLSAFDRGDLTEFDKICSSYADQMNAQPILVANSEFLRQKITIMALLDFAFERVSERKLTFDEVATRCRLPREEVDFLLMRAMCLHLIDGSIDGVNDCVTITRVQPRVIGRDHVGDMARRLGVWCNNVSTTLSFVENESSELFT